MSFSFLIFILHRAFPRVFRHEIRVQSDAHLHREYNLALKNKASATQCSTGALLRMLRHGRLPDCISRISHITLLLPALFFGFMTRTTNPQL